MVGQQAVVNLTLEVGAIAEKVEVTEEAPLVNTTVSSTSGLINETQIKELPLNGRSFEQLLTLNTGTINNNVHSTGSSFSVGGKRTETNRFTMNGVDYVGDNATGQYIAPQGASQQLLGVDAVREYNVLGETYGAEYGKRSGGQITVVTTSGTNKWRGSLFEYLRNSAFDARESSMTGIETATGKPTPRHSNAISLAVLSAVPSSKTRCSSSEITKDSRKRLAKTNVAIVPSIQARQGRLPNAAGQYVEVPGLQREMLRFFQYWPNPTVPDLRICGVCLPVSPTTTAIHRGG